MNSKENPMLVIGGGIGGLTTALTLAKKGVYVKVLEQAPEFLEVGAGIQLAANATRILKEIDVLDRLKDIAVFPKRFVIMDAFTGEELSALDLGETYQKRYGGPYIVLHRADLQNTLYETAKESDFIELLTNQHIVNSTTTENGIEIETATGEIIHGQAVVGADGIWSKQRPKVVTDDVVCSQYVAYRGTLNMDEMKDKVQTDDVYMWIGPNLHLIQYPVRSGKLYNQVVVFKSPNYSPEIEHTDQWGTPEEMDQVFAGTCDVVQHAISFISRQRRWPMYDRNPITNWTNGKMTLLGDAAHPMLQYLAQGGCQAIEDAACLAEIFTTTEQVEDAFIKYQEMRIPRATFIQNGARIWGEIAHATDAPTILLRNTLFKDRTDDDFKFIDQLHGFKAEKGYVEIEE